MSSQVLHSRVSGLYRRRSASAAEVTPTRVATGRRWWRPLTSVRVLLVALIGVTVLVAGPARGLEEAAHRHWARLLTPELLPFIQNVLDRIAGQAVCAPVLGAVALTLAWRHRTFRPIWCALVAEAAFYGGVGLMKLILARPAPTTRDSDMLDGGIVTYGWHGISYPSGHAAEAILIYGTAVYLIARWTSVSPTTLRRLVIGVGAITLNAVAVSYYLGWHWIGDLIAGILVGGLLLRLLIEADRRDWPLPWGERVIASAGGRGRPSALAAQQMQGVCEAQRIVRS